MTRGAAVAVAPGAPASFGTTRVTNDGGTSQTPCRTRTGASSTTGVSSTSTCAQFRVRVTTRPPARR
ncbi:MAG: hypothetical protein HYU26_17915 [Candidatus Rokubacteria bacterium]|nr:hypothetical protein [Candidatus Rokubacteria bacterium]